MVAKIPGIDLKVKSLPKWLLIILLTAGAALTLGLLSFGGIYALMPLIPVAGLAFGLSTVYESEIYFKNIQLAIEKLTKYNYLQRKMARNLLLDKAKAEKNDLDCQFLKDYRIQLDIVCQFHEKKLDTDSKKRKKKAEEELRHMEKWYAKLLFSKSQLKTSTNASQKQPLQNEFSLYEKEVLGLIENINGILPDDGLERFHDKYHRHQWYYRGASILAITGGLFAILGMVLLLGGVLPLIPFTAALSAPVLVPIIITASVLAGIAYGFLSYNAVTDMINNETLRKFFTDIQQAGKKSITKAIGMGIVTTVLIGLAVTLTVFTAGTWWTIAKNAGPVLSWLRVKAKLVYKAITLLPRFVVGIIHPMVMGLTAMAFNIQNSSESFDVLSEFFKGFKHFFKHLSHVISEKFQETREKENWLQILNPFRIITKILVTPLRFIMFIGHLISIGVTADRFPGIPSIVTALVGTFCEGMEDLHYFVEFDHDHGHGHGHDHAKEEREHLINERLGKGCGHDHSNDLPTKLINLTVAISIKPFSFLWNYGASQFNRWINDKQPLRFSEIFEDRNNAQKKQNIPENTSLEKQKSQDWHKAHLGYRIDKFNREHFGSYNFMDNALVKEKRKILEGMVVAIKNHEGSAQEAYQTHAKAQEKYATLSTPRGVGFFRTGTVKSKEFVDSLNVKIPAAG